MFVETAGWIEDQLGMLPLPARPEVIDVGSSTLRYRTIEQPHVDRMVLAPLRARGARILHADAKRGDGVDVAIDLDDRDHGLDALPQRSFDLVIAASLLSNVEDPRAAVGNLARLVGPGGLILCTNPSRFRRTRDPRDNGWRTTPQDLISAFAVHDPTLQPLADGSIRIDSAATYRGLLARTSWMPAGGGRWVPLPGFSESLRRVAPALRWRDSAVVLRRPPAP